VIKLTEQVETKTHEEDEDVLFKMWVNLDLDDRTTLMPLLLGVQSFSGLIVDPPSGRNAELEMFVCSVIRQPRKSGSLCDATKP